jgi:hypothetical protein
MICGMGNTEGEDGKVGPFLDLEMDYNWGDSGYFCMGCASKVAGYTGWKTPDEYKDLERELTKVRQELHDVQADLEIKQRKVREQGRTLSRIAEGSSELKKIRRDRAKKVAA